MRVLLTGATGFLGRHVLPLLSQHDVCCLTRSVSAAGALRCASVVVGDVGRPDAWRNDVERFRPDGCIHLAWEGLPDYSAERCRANLDADISFFKWLAQTGVGRVVVSGSCWEYGRATGAVAEDQEAVDVGQFGAAKRAAQVVLDSLAREHGFDYRWGRLFYVYGPGQRPTSLVPSLCSAYASHMPPQLREPGAAHDFIYCADAARGLLALLESDRAFGVFNIGTGRLATTGYIARLVAQHFDAALSAPERPAESGFWADTTRMFDMTGWRATTPIEAGIARTLHELAPTV